MIEVPPGFCYCGCGRKTTLILKSSRKKGLVKGQYRKFIHGHNRYKEGRVMSSNGYAMMARQDHPRASKYGYVYEHVLVAEKKIGRFLQGKELVHHVDGNKSNNSPSNLHICRNNAEHRRLHRQMAAFAATGHSDWLMCGLCHEYDSPDNLYQHNGRNVKHRACAAKYERDRKARRQTHG